MKHLVHERLATYEAGVPKPAVNVPKRAVNVTVNADLLQRARHFDVNLSQTLERALVQEVSKRARRHWLAENRDAIHAYNREVEASGCFGDSLRSF